MSKKVYSDVPWQGLLTDERQHDDPVLSQKCLEETALVCSRISNHSGYARLTRYYNILYQSFMPNCKLSVEVLRRHYHISSEVISFICSGRTVRICNQRVLTFLLTEFEKDYDISKFFSIVKQLIQLSDLRTMIDRLRDEFPAETDKDIQVIVDENTEVVDEDQDMKIQFEASDLPSYSAVDEDVTVLEIKEFQAEITVRRVRTSIVSDSHTLSDSPTIDTSPVLHKTKHLYTPPVTSQSVFTVTLNDATHHTMPNLEGNTSHTVSTPSHQPVLLSPQLSGAEETDVFSEEVKSKPHTLSQDHNTSFEGSYSSEASTPAKSPPQFSSSPFSPSRDHSSLTSYSENLYPTGPLSDKLLLQATATTAASVSSKASAKPSVSAAASVMGPAVDPVTLLEEKGFEPLKSRYSLLYQSFPENYMHTVSKLEQHLTDTDITSILGCTNTILANKKILDSLIVHMKCREDLLDLCDHLEKISESPSMSNVVNELRNDVINNIQKEPHPKSHSKMDDEPDPPVFSRIEAIDPNCKVVQILKKYYHTLCHSLSPNIIKNLSAVAGICATDSRFRSQIEKCQTPVQANRILLDRLILSLDFEERMLEFCDVLDSMIEDGELKQNLEMFRNEILAVLSNKPEGSTDWRIKPVTFLKVQTPEGVKTVCIKDPHQQHMYAADGTTTKSVMAVSHCPHCHHHHHHSHDVNETESGDDVLQPPPIPQYNVSRLKLEKELTDAVLDSSQAKSAVAVTIVGDGGFGKSTLAKAFCHSTTTKQYFPDGFLIVELGPNAPDPRSTLRRLYRRLSCGLRIDGDVNSIAQYIHTLIIENYPSILVIIDDVCNLHDAQPYIMAFRNCKIIVTTKLGDVCQQLSSSKVVIVGQMEPLEATKLLSFATGQLSEDDEMIVRELANDLHFWPLLLCIARGQLQMNFKKAGVHAIGNLQSDLYGKGLEHVTRASDENDSHSRKTALTACVEASLELLTPEENDSLLNLVHHIGGGGVIETQHVPKICNIDEVSSIQLLDKLNSLGLITFTLSSGNAKEAIKIHNVIAQYLLDSQVYNPPEHLGDSQEAEAFMNPAEDGQTVSILLFSRRNPQNTADKITGTPEWCLNNVLQNYDNYQFDSFIKINERHIGSWSTDIFNLLQNVCSVAYTSPAKFPDLKSIESEADRLLTECQSVMMEYSQEINQLKQQVDTMVKQRDYNGAVKKLEEYFTNFSLKQVALGTKKLVERVASQCDQKYKHSLEVSSEFLHCFTPEHDFFLKLQLPSIKLILDLHRRIVAALASGPPAVDEVADEIWTSKLSDQSSLLNANYMIKLQEVAPHQVLAWQQINSF